MFVQLKRIGTISRANTEAEHYNPRIFIPQPPKPEKLWYVGLQRITAV
jgi:hypothetical protein